MTQETQKPQLNIPAVSGSYVYRNEYPKCVETLWDKLPEEGQRVEVDYGNSTNNYIWFIGGKFVNKYGFEMNGVMDGDLIIATNVLWLCVRLRSVGIERSGSLRKTAVSCCFLLLVISTLENILKISLKKFANSK